MAFERKALVRVREGLHARPATEFVRLARSFACELEILREGRAANAKSAVKLMLLGIKEEDEIVIRAEGADASEAVESLARFVETPDAGQASPVRAAVAPQDASAVDENAARGVAASEGAALGPAFAVFAELPPLVPRRLAKAEIEGEIGRFRQALTSAVAEPAATQDTSEGGLIAAALAELAQDEEFAGAIEARIAQGLDALAATLEVGAGLEQRFASLDDAYLKARAEDVRSLARAIAFALAGIRAPSLAEAPPGAIVVAEEIGAVELAKAPLDKIAGIVCRKGAATSHIAILARTHGIPAVLGYSGALERLRQARRVGLDGGTGEVWLDPDAAAARPIEARIAAERAERLSLASFKTREPRTRDGRLIEIAANLGSLKEIDAALEVGAMGVGLFRTELLFMQAAAPPSEDEQAQVYAALAAAFAPHPVIVRTLDVGGDKAVPGIEIPAEDNPFLGWRGLRLCLDRPELFKPQLKALLRAALAGNVKIMLPMVTEVAEVRRAKVMLGECRAELAASGVPAGEAELGVMIETPAAALLAHELAPEVAFFSIGTNDLAQYVMAADRLNPRVAHLNRADHPAVLRAIAFVCAAAKDAGIWVGVCGEAAARPDLAATFVRMGVTELSMSPQAILRAKKSVSEM